MRFVRAHRSHPAQAELGRGTQIFTGILNFFEFQDGFEVE